MAAAANGHAGRSSSGAAQQQQRQLAANHAAAAAVSTAQTVNDALRDEGFVLCEVAGGECDLDLSHINDPDRKELWVVRLPDGVSERAAAVSAAVGASDQHAAIVPPLSARCH